MAIGRPRLSDAEHALRGTKPHSSTAKTVSALSAAKPKMPSHLTPEARKEWKRVLPLLLQRSSLTDGDATALSLYCETFSRWLLAKKDVETNGLTITTVVLDGNGQAISTRRTNPALRTLENCERNLRAHLRELGLTPATRERITPAKQQPQKAFNLLEHMKRKAGEI